MSAPRSLSPDRCRGSFPFLQGRPRRSGPHHHRAVASGSAVPQRGLRIRQDPDVRDGDGWYLLKVAPIHQVISVQYDQDLIAQQQTARSAVSYPDIVVAGVLPDQQVGSGSVVVDRVRFRFSDDGRIVSVRRTHGVKRAAEQQPRLGHYQKSFTSRVHDGFVSGPWKSGFEF